ncbi:hypothetical protein BH09PLA1_BH09PLA1_14490 [soil metagenome]
MFIDQLEARQLFAAGNVDPYFGDSGIAQGGRYIVPASDGRTYTISDADGGGVTIRRAGSDGQLDPGYMVTLNPTKAYSAAITSAKPAADSRGRLFIALSGGIFCVGTNGKVDRTFGNAGVVMSPLEYSVRDVVVQRDDRIVLAGSQRKQNGLIDQEPGQPFFAEAAAVARLNPNGTLDSTFGTNGIQLASEYTSYGLQAPKDRRINDVAIDSSNHLVMLREITSGNDYNDYISSHSTFDVLRLNPDGTEDSSIQRIQGATQFKTDDIFGDLFTTQLHGRRPVRVLVDSSNHITVALAEGNRETEQPGVLRLSSDGTPDTTFGGGDGFVDDFATDDHILELFDLLTLTNGRVLVSLRSQASNSVTSSRLIAFNADGSRDTGFGSDGVVAFGEAMGIGAISLAKDGSILIRVAHRNNQTFDAIYELQRLWRDDAPAAIATVKNITLANRTVAIDVAYRDDGAIDISTVDSRDLRVTGANGYVKYARFDSIVSSTNNNGMVVARYKLAAPGGSWTGKNGTYDVRLRADQVRDDEGNGTTARSLATIVVNVPGEARPAWAQSMPATSTSTNQRDGVFKDIALIDELL